MLLGRQFARGALVVAALSAAGCGGSGALRSRSGTTTSPSVTAGSGGSSSANTNDAPPRTLRLRSQLLSQAQVPTPGGGTGATGAQLAYSAELFRGSGGPAVGRSLTACVRVSAGGGIVYNCTLSFLLPEGTIYGQAMSAPGGPSSGIVSGGTGAYGNVRGTFTYKSTGTPEVALRFTLVG